MHAVMHAMTAHSHASIMTCSRLLLQVVGPALPRFLSCLGICPLFSDEQFADSQRAFPGSLVVSEGTVIDYDGHGYVQLSYTVWHPDVCWFWPQESSSTMQYTGRA